MTATHSGPMPAHRRTDRIAAGEPLHWLSLGLQDFRRAPLVGLAFILFILEVAVRRLFLGES